MAAYVIVVINKIKDMAALKQYRSIGVPSLQATNGKFLTRPGPVEVREGAPVEGVVVLEFPNMEEARAWYDSPVYQSALQHRYAGADCHAILVEGT